MPKTSGLQEKKAKTSTVEEKEGRKSLSKPKAESPYSKFVENAVKVSGKSENNGKRSASKAEEGEKQNKKSKSKKMVFKHPKKEELSSVSPKKEKSPSHKMKNVKKNESKSRSRKLTSLGKKKRKEEEKEELSESQEISQDKSTPKKRKDREREKSKSKSRSKRERSRTKSIRREKEEKSMTKSVPSGQKEESDTPSKTGSSPTSKISGSSSKSVKYKEISTGKIPRNFTSHSGKKKIKTSKVKNLVSISSESQPQGSKKISVKNVKESSSNIESSSSIDLSAEQRKRVSELNYGPDSQRISQEVEEVIKRIENKKKQKPKLLEKKRNRDDSLVANHTSKDFDYILQKNPNSKKKPYINLEELSKHHLITYSDILLALLEVGKNSNSYLFAYSSKSKCFWTDILQYTILKKIFSDFKAETLRKYWSELSKYDTEEATDLIKKNKSYLDKLPVKLGTIVSSLSKMLNGKIKDLREYIDNIQMDIRKKEIFEHEFKNPETGEVTKVKEVRTTYRKRYEPGSSKDFKEVYHQNSNLNDFQKVMKNIKKDDSIKVSYLNEVIEEEKRKMNMINEEDKFIFKAIDNVLDTLSSEFKNYSTDYILETMKQNSMDISKTYNCLKEPMKNRNIGFSALDDKVLLKKTGEEYKILLKEKGKEAIQEREEFLNH